MMADKARQGKAVGWCFWGFGPNTFGGGGDRLC